MRKIKGKKLVLGVAAVLVLCGVLFVGGCPKMIALMGTENVYEKKVPAEYDLSEQLDSKVLILVNQPAWLRVQVDMRYYLDKSIRNELVKQIKKMAADDIVDYGKLSELRSVRSDFASLTPVEVGKALGAELVLYVVLESQKLLKVADVGYYKGGMSCRAVLVDVGTGAKVWPKDESSKYIRVGFEVESRGEDFAVKRLASSTSHCIVRYFYNCRETKFKIIDDKSGDSWGYWD